MKTTESTPQAAPIQIKIKPYKLKELAFFYEVSKPVLRAMLAPYHRKIGKRKGHYYNVYQVKFIIRILGMPGNYVFKDNILYEPKTDQDSD
jgi:hypothetical protein